MGDSIIAFRQEIIALKPKLNLLETEDTWDVIARSIASLDQLCQVADGKITTDVVLALKNFHRPLTNAMSSDRTRLSGPAIELISTVATGIGANFEPLLPLYLPILLTLCSRTNKVMVARARTCIFSIIEGTQLPSILPYFTHFIKEKSTSSRLVIAEGAWMCLNCFNPPDLEKDSRAQDIEAIIRATARDRSSDIRKVSKKLFESYKVLLPSRVESFTAPLTPTIRKYLDIPTGIQRGQLPLNVQSKVASGSNHKPSNSVVTTNPSVAVRINRNEAHLRSQSQSTTTVALPIPIRNFQPSRCVPASQPISYKNHVLRITKEEPGPAESHRPQRHLVAASSNPPTSTIGCSGPKRIPPPNLSHSVQQEIQLPNRPPSTTMNNLTTSDFLSAAEKIPCKSIIGNRASKFNLQLNSQSSKAMKVSSQTAKQVTGRPKISTVTQPTLSQLARSKKPIINKSTSLAPKPLWGRQTARRKVQKSTSTVGTKTGVQPNKLSQPAPASGVQKDRCMSPSQIALPRSPSPPSITETATSTTSSEVEPCEKATTSPINQEEGKMLSATSLLTRQNYQEHIPSTISETPSSRFALSGTKTPISALLSSIQHGFVFTPTSPLSPPHHYLNKDSSRSNDPFYSQFNSSNLFDRDTIASTSMVLGK